MTQQVFDISYHWIDGNLAKALHDASEKAKTIHDDKVEGIIVDYQDDMGWTVKIVYRN